MLARKALAGTAAAPKVYVEDVFSTYLYTGTGSAQTITNNIDLSSKGGLVWLKKRSAVSNHWLLDTIRGGGKPLNSNTTNAEPGTTQDMITSFNSNGFSLGTEDVNDSSATYASWTFRKAEKFFDVVTYTGNGSARTISHNLGSTPGCIIVKRTDTTGDWYVYHRSNTAAPETDYLLLNSTAATADLDTVWNDTSPTSTVFSVGTNTGVNANSGTYVAYLFAHDAGGFGDAGDQSVIKCGSYTTDGSGNATIDLGWEPQWILVKPSSGTGNWWILDSMRAFTVNSSANAYLLPNSAAAEATNTYPVPTATGFTTINTANTTYIYIAIRRGPMKTPTTGTSVFVPTTYTGNGTSQTITSPGFAPDMLIGRVKASSTASVVDKLRGSLNYLYTSNTDGEVGSNSTSDVTAFTNTGFNVGADNRGNWNTSSGSEIVWTFKRAPGFFDVVTYAGTGSAGATTSHNLGVSPELIITKVRNFTGEDWIVHYRDGSTITAGYLNTTAAFAASGSAPSTDLNSFSSTSYTRNTGNRRVNSGSYNYVAYLFASCLGVSKIGAVTVASSAINVDCGFTSSARFVLLKRTSGASGWIVFDSARGIVAGDDPYLYLNSSAAENSDGASDIIDTYSSGFTLPAGGLSGITGEGTYLYLAIA